MGLQGKQVLVTGAAGFIGSHLVQRLINDGAQVRALLHYRSQPGLQNLELLPADELAQVQIVRGDVQDPFVVNSCVAGCEIVFHLAALIGIPYSYRAPASYVSTNIQGTLNVLEACRTHRTTRLVHTSTSECYGTAQYTPIDEGHPLQGQSPYSATKIAADKLAESYFRSFQLPVTVVRPFNTYGPRQTARAVIPTIVSQLLNGSPTLKLGSLEPVRDLTYVEDTVDGFVRAATASHVEGLVINLGAGKGIGIGDLARRIMRLMQVEVPIEQQAERVRPQHSEVMNLISDNRRAREVLGWQPVVTLEQGLTHVIEFIDKNANLYTPDCYEV